MNTKRNTLISILAVGVILVGILAFQALSVTNAKAEANSPVGAWNVIVTVTGEGAPPPFISEMIFSSDGTVTCMESDGRLGIGVWEKISGNQYAFTMWEYYAQGGMSFQAKLRSTFTLADGKDQYDGPFFVQISIQDGPTVFEGYGNATGVRNQVEPMP